MWKGHFQPILLTGALDVTVIPMHNAWTQYSHVCFTLPRLQTCEYPTHIAFVSRLPSPHTLQRVESVTLEKDHFVVCVPPMSSSLEKKKRKGPDMSSPSSWVAASSSFSYSIFLKCTFI